MWSRVLLKERGKTAFKANYWKCVLVALVLSLLVGGGSFGSGFNIGSTYNQNNSGSTDDNYSEYFDDYDSSDQYGDDSYIDNWKIEEFEGIGDVPNISNPGSGSSLPYLGGFLAIFIIIFIVAFIIAFALGIFVFNPLEVGCRKFFLDNSEGRGDDAGTMGFAFKNNYGNVVKVQFFRSIFVLLWSLLLIVPGIIKSYEYYLVPYLLAENPNIDRKEALETSKRLMYGNKMDTFVLELSFIGWELLAACTLGILGIFYVNPYLYATEAELYRVLSGKVSGIDDGEEERQAELARLYGGVRDNSDNSLAGDEDGEDVYITFEEPKDTSTFD